MHLIMFDIDGTLVDSHGFDGELFADAVKQELGVQVDETWKSYQHVTDSGILEEVLRENIAEGQRGDAFERVKRRFISLVHDYVSSKPGGLKPIPGAREFVHALRSRPEVVVALATGGWRSTAELKLCSVGIDFAGIPFATSSDALSRVEIMRMAEQRAGPTGKFSKRTYFGDAPWDKEACGRMGYEFVAVGDRVEHSCRFEDFHDQSALFSVLGA